jgi:hypothetical protein
MYGQLPSLDVPVLINTLEEGYEDEDFDRFFA